MENIDEKLKRINIKYKDLNENEKEISPEEIISKVGENFRNIENQKNDEDKEIADKIRRIGKNYEEQINKKK